MKPFYFIIENDWFPRNLLPGEGSLLDNIGGWGNGYVAIPKGHRWYGRDYNEIEVDVYGGLTFGKYGSQCDASMSARSKKNLIGFWIVGFDTFHLGQTLDSWPKDRCEKEAQYLLAQVVATGKWYYPIAQTIKKIKYAMDKNFRSGRKRLCIYSKKISGACRKFFAGGRL